MSVADNRISAVHRTGRDMLQTRARLAGWVEARERGVSSTTSDAITDAALAGAIELLESWEADRTRKGAPMRDRIRRAINVARYTVEALRTLRRIEDPDLTAAAIGELRRKYGLKEDDRG